jgi:hypothetical protein
MFEYGCFRVADTASRCFVENLYRIRLIVKPTVAGNILNH